MTTILIILLPILYLSLAIFGIWKDNKIFKIISTILIILSLLWGWKSLEQNIILQKIIKIHTAQHEKNYEIIDKINEKLSDEKIEDAKTIASEYLNNVNKDATEYNDIYAIWHNYVQNK